MDITSILIGLLAGIIAGGGIAFLVLNNKSNSKATQIIKEAEQKANQYKKSRELEAKEKFLKLKQDHQKETQQRESTISRKEDDLRKKDQSLSDRIQNQEHKFKEVESIKKNLSQQLEIVNIKKTEIEKAHVNQVKQLEKIAGLTAEEAKKDLVEALVDEAKTDAISKIKLIVEEAKLKANKEAKRMILQTIQRTAAEQAIENTVTVFNIDNDDIKGRIIGREGRNIRALEAATGIEIIVDDTPEAIILSGFDPVRREIARLSLHRLVTDGRIHPARIEEVVQKTKKDVDNEIIEHGERAVIDLGINGLHPELIRIVGRMRYRSSYGQNLLQHSREVANMCAIMAAEFGLDPKMAKRAGLLHDIGKVPDEDAETPHALLGMKWAEKYGESPEVCNAIGAHHDEIEMTNLISPIVQSCDAISGSRPGARREDGEAYIKRLQDLEKLALGFDGVEKGICHSSWSRATGNRGTVTCCRTSKQIYLSFDISQKDHERNDLSWPNQSDCYS